MAELQVAATGEEPNNHVMDKSVTLRGQEQVLSSPRERGTE